MSDFLKALAPILGSAFGGPLGGVAATFLADKLGLEANTVEAVSEVLNSGKMTPEQLSSIKAAELDFKKFVETNKIDVLKIEAADRESARGMMISTRSKTPAILTWVIVVAVLGLEGAILLNGMPSGVNDFVLGRILVTLETSLGLTLAFWFGTTAGSQSKNEMLAKASFK